MMAQQISFPELLTEEQAAQRIGVSPSTLATWRCTGRYELRFLKAGRLVRYRAQDVLAFINSRLVGGGAESDGEQL
jgi:predicted site-specific integrase-resolvase